jgi:hypothetical protein
VRNRNFRRHQTARHLARRLKEDRNQHYRDLSCPCWWSPRAIARFREQPQVCSGPCCGNQRHAWGRKDRTMGERRFFCKSDNDW